uniref:contactin-associated protein-like 2 n=1 Tax=Styela clava TaxID=7725 RepID=UPI001939E3AB|nr:contactin-associated protein-like 2 [Styela clava]
MQAINMSRLSILLIALYFSATRTKADDVLPYEESGVDSEPVEEQCCIDMQTQIDELKGHVAALQTQLTSLQSRVEQIEETINYTDPKISCEHYKLSGYDSGYYEIDPDGPKGSIPPFQVYCNMTSDPEWAVTMLGHNSEERTYVYGCQDPGCFSHNITYNQTWEQIQAVMWTSRSCQQYLSYECLGSMLFSYNDYAWWVSRDGEEQHYWAGADPGSNMCECGKKGTCEGKSTTCNCDNNDLVWRQDDG